MADEFREAGAHFERGVLLENGNDLNGARSAYEQAVAVDPRHVEAVASLAWLMLRRETPLRPRPLVSAL